MCVCVYVVGCLRCAQTTNHIHTSIIRSQTVMDVCGGGLHLRTGETDVPTSQFNPEADGEAHQMHAM